MYRIRKARPEDLTRIMEIYACARAFMARTGNPNQWGTTNPPQAQLEQDIKEGNLYAVCDEARVCGVFFFAVGEDPTYQTIYYGDWHSGEQYGTIHRIASDGSGGILKACVDYCWQLCPYLRIDTHEDNRVMQKAVSKLGFRRCGIIYIADGTSRIAYDRI